MSNSDSSAAGDSFDCGNKSDKNNLSWNATIKRAEDIIARIGDSDDLDAQVRMVSEAKDYIEQATLRFQNAKGEIERLLGVDELGPKK